MNLTDLLLSMESGESEKIRPPFPYPGNKYKLLDKILPHLPYTEMYCEPFGGSGSVLLARRPCKLDVFNDRYSGTVCFYKCLRDPELLQKLLDRLQFMLYSREEFVWCSKTWKDCSDPVERAARWYYTINTSFLSKMKHFGRAVRPMKATGRLLQEGLDDFYKIHQRLKFVQIENLDWRQVLKDYNTEECVWYMDPPYMQTTKDFYTCEMSVADHQELLDTIFDLKGFVAISSYKSKLYESYPWDENYEWEYTSNVSDQSGPTKVRHKMVECLWIKH